VKRALKNASKKGHFSWGNHGKPIEFWGISWYFYSDSIVIYSVHYVFHNFANQPKLRMGWVWAKVIFSLKWLV
jgi:hypothetical protein